MEYWSNLAPDRTRSDAQQYDSQDELGDSYDHHQVSETWKDDGEDDTQYTDDYGNEHTSDYERAGPIPAAQQGLLASASHRSRAALGLNEYTLSRLWYKLGKEVERHSKKYGQQPTERQARAWAIECAVLGPRRDVLMAPPSDHTAHVHEALTWIIREGLAELFEKNDVHLPSTPEVPTSSPQQFVGTAQQDPAAPQVSTDEIPVKESFDRMTARTILGMKERALYNDFRDYCFHIATVRGLSGRIRGWLAWQTEDVRAEILKLAIPQHARALMNTGRHAGNKRLWEAFEFLWKTVMWDLSSRRENHREMPGVGKRKDFLDQYPDPKEDETDGGSPIPEVKGTRRSKRVRGIRAETSGTSDCGEDEYRPEEDESSVDVESVTSESDSQETPVANTAHIPRPRRNLVEVRSAPTKIGGKRKSRTPPTETRGRKRRPATRFKSPPSPSRTMIAASASRFRNVAAPVTGSTAPHTTQTGRTARSPPADAPHHPSKGDEARQIHSHRADYEDDTMIRGSDFPPSSPDALVGGATSTNRNIPTTRTRASISVPTPARAPRPKTASKPDPINPLPLPRKRGQARQFRRNMDEEDQATRAERDDNMGAAAARSRPKKSYNLRDPSLPRDPAPHRFSEKADKGDDASKIQYHQDSAPMSTAFPQLRDIVPSPTAIEAAVNWAMLDKSVAEVWSVLQIKQQEALRTDLTTAYGDRVGDLSNGESMDIVHEILVGMVQDRIEFVKRQNELKVSRRF